MHFTEQSLKEALDTELVVAHLGTVESYDCPRKALNDLLAYHAAITAHLELLNKTEMIFEKTMERIDSVQCNDCFETEDGDAILVDAVKGCLEHTYKELDIPVPESETGHW